MYYDYFLFNNVTLINLISSAQRQLVTQLDELSPPELSLAGISVPGHLLQPLLFPADGTVGPFCSLSP